MAGAKRMTDTAKDGLGRLEGALGRMDALLVRMEGLAEVLRGLILTEQPSGVPVNRIMPWQQINWGPLNASPEEKQAEDDQIQKIIDKALQERQEPLPLAD